MTRILALLLALLATPAIAQPARPPLVLAAASLQEALTAAADDWAKRGHARPVLSFASSAQLARQVEAGAPADMFVSADEQWMDYVAGKRLIRAGTRADFVTNRLVLIAPANSPLKLRSAPKMALAAALGQGRLAIGDPDTVPGGRYAKQALTSLGAWPSVAGRIARGESVRAALALVARGEAPLGVVYATDAAAESKVRVLGLFPANSHTPIRYPLALLAAGTSPDAEGFRRYLLSAPARALFKRFGFGTP